MLARVLMTLHLLGTESFHEFFPVLEIKNLSSIFSLPLELDATIHQYWIRDSWFTKVFSEVGGAIVMTQNYSQLLVSDSVFSECYITGESGNLGYSLERGTIRYACGGAIFFWCDSHPISSLYVKRVCGYNCSARSSAGFDYEGYTRMSSGHFLFSFVPLESSIKISDVSVQLCAPKVYGFAAFFLENGDITVNNINLTKCCSLANSCLHFRPSKNATMQYASLIRNNASLYSLHIRGKASEYETNFISYLNFVSNSIIENIYAQIVSNDEASTKFFSCVFQNNSGHLFDRQNGNLYIFDCQIDSHSFTRSLPVYHNIVAFQKTLLINHYGSALCVTPIPPPTDDGSQGNIPPTPPQSIPLTPTECQFSQAEQLNIFPISKIVSILIFEFTIIT